MSTNMAKINPIVKWIMSGGFAVFVDLTLLFLLVEYAHIYYLFAATIAFLVSATVNYTISGLTIFTDAQHSVQRSYLTFMGISLIGLAVIAVSLYILVDVLHVYYLFARFFLAGTVGVGSFFLHKYLSFKDTSRNS